MTTPSAKRTKLGFPDKQARQTVNGRFMEDLIRAQKKGTIPPAFKTLSGPPTDPAAIFTITRGQLLYYLKARKTDGYALPMSQELGIIQVPKGLNVSARESLRDAVFDRVVLLGPSEKISEYDATSDGIQLGGVEPVCEVGGLDVTKNTGPFDILVGDDLYVDVPDPKVMADARVPHQFVVVPLREEALTVHFNGDDIKEVTRSYGHQRRYLGRSMSVARPGELVSFQRS